MWWYIDDGQLVMHPTKVDCVLRSLDRRLEEAGASWGSKALGHKVKSSVKVYIPEDEVEACCGWRTDYHLLQNDYRYRSEIKSKTIGLYQITDVTDLYKIENNKSAKKLQTLQTLQL